MGAMQPYNSDIEILGRRPDRLRLDEAMFGFGLLGLRVLSGHHQTLHFRFRFLWLDVGVHDWRDNGPDLGFGFFWGWFGSGNHDYPVFNLSHSDFGFLRFLDGHVSDWRNVGTKAHGLVPESRKEYALK